jgi:hypothetical protein
MLKRQVGGIGISDLLVQVLIADTAVDGMLGGATSATNGIVLVATTVFWNFHLQLVDLPGIGLSSPLSIPSATAGERRAVVATQHAARVHHPRGVAQPTAPTRYQ